MAATIRQALSRLTAPAQVDGLAISSMAEAGVPLDRDNKELYPIIAWFDDRTMPQQDWWREHLGAVGVFAISGVHLDYIFSINKIMWLREHEPDVFGRMARFLCMSDYLSFRLTGEQAMSPSIASRTMAFDVTTRNWSATMLEMAGLKRSLFPSICESGGIVGRVTRQAAAETGLREGVPVMAGGHDHLCGALGSGVFEPGPVLNSVGTTEVILVSTNQFSAPGENPEEQGFSCGCHVVPGRYYAFGGTRSAGSMVEWLRSIVEKELAAGGRDPYQAMAEAGLSAPMGSRGLFVLPFVAGGRPHRDPEARGVMFGLRTTHTTADLIRASFEGLGYELRWAIELLESFTGVPVSRLRAIGGGARNDLWLRVKADITGKPIDIGCQTENAALGAALLAGLGTGVYASPGEAVQRVYRIDRTIEPDADAHDMYTQWYREIYQGLYPQLRQSCLAAARLFPEA